MLNQSFAVSMCLQDDADELPLTNIKTERQRWPTKTIKIMVVRNPVRCYGDKVGILILWRTFRTILLLRINQF